MTKLKKQKRNNQPKATNMKKQNQNTIVTLSERFDKQLLNILSQELAALKNAKNRMVKNLKSDSGDDLLVA